MDHDGHSDCKALHTNLTYIPYNISFPVIPVSIAWILYIYIGGFYIHVIMVYACSLEKYRILGEMWELCIGNVKFFQGVRELICLSSWFSNQPERKCSNPLSIIMNHILQSKHGSIKHREGPNAIRCKLFHKNLHHQEDCHLKRFDPTRHLIHTRLR